MSMIRITLLTIPLTLLAILLGQPTQAAVPNATAQFSCTNVTEIPQIECEALVALYEDMGGPDRADGHNWLDTNTPCSWGGVTCEDGHVTVFNSARYAPNDPWSTQDRELWGPTNTIPIEIGNLLHLTNLSISSANIITVPVEIGNLAKLESLSLYGNKIAELPAEISQLSNLENLGVAHNRLNILPADIGNLSKLKALRLHQNQLVELPSTIGALTELITITLMQNQMENLPRAIGNLSNLAELDLSNNQLASLPVELGQLTNLTGLDLSNNQLSSLPTELGTLTNLSTLEIKDNQIRQLPKSIGNLSSLPELDLSNNQLLSLPRELGLLTNLTSLNLGSNQLNTIPSEIGHLSGLTTLDLSVNQLSSLPAELGQLANLNQLNLNTNRLSSLPSEIGFLSNLTDLDLSSNQLIVLPDTFWELSNLIVLNLSSNQLSAISTDIENLVKIQELYLQSNHLDEISISIINLPILKKLNLSDNQLQVLPAEFGAFNQLTHLWLNTNQLNELPPEIGNISTLFVLSLNRNQLTELPPEIRNLSNLTSLYLRGNRLTELPLEIGYFSWMSLLDLSSNRLSSLPTTITFLEDIPSNGFWVDASIYLHHNRLDITNENTISWARSHAHGWSNTQTIAPKVITATATGPESIELTWEPITFQDHNGYYEISVTDDDTFTVHSATASKSDSHYVIDGLSSSTAYSFRLRTYTAAHENQPNELWSDYSESISATTLDQATPTGTPTATPTNTPIPTHTPTSIDTAIPIPTTTSTYTLVPTATDTPTSTPTTISSATATNVPTSAPTPVTLTPTFPPPTPPPNENTSHEPNDTCQTASPLPINTSAQIHTFQARADIDWAKFEVTANTTYRIEVVVPADSPADVNLELYPDCDSTPDNSWSESFSPSVRLDFTAPATGSVYLRLSNHRASIFGNHVTYQLSVRSLSDDSGNRAAIIVAGRQWEGDRLQDNIHHITDRIYRTFQAYDYSDDDIYYLATDSDLPGYDGAADLHNLRVAIIDWAANRLTSGGVLNLYMIDHGNVDILYLDREADQALKPTDLDSWLSELEGKVEDLTINVIIEACQSGSFISPAGGKISGPGRLVITSTDDVNDAKASFEGAQFSDQFITWLHQGYNIAASFDQAKEAAKKVFAYQNAWIDANGDGRPNEYDDIAAAAQRGFNFTGTFNSNWPPYIFSADPPQSLNNFRGTIYADVRDDQDVKLVYAVVYPPSYEPPATRNELLAETLDKIILDPQPNLTSQSSQHSATQGTRYGGNYNFVESGTYRLLIHAEDRQGLSARPVEITFDVVNGVTATEALNQLYLPLIKR